MKLLYYSLMNRMNSVALLSNEPVSFPDVQSERFVLPLNGQVGKVTALSHSVVDGVNPGSLFLCG